MKIGLQRACFMIMILPLLSQVVAQSQAPASGTLKGTVTDETGAVIEGILIRIVSWGPNERRRIVESEMAAHTDTKGQFKFELAPGIYDIFVSGSAWAPIAKQVKVETGKETVFNPKLKLGRFIKLIP